VLDFFYKLFFCTDQERRRISALSQTRYAQFEDDNGSKNGDDYNDEDLDSNEDDEMNVERIRKADEILRQHLTYNHLLESKLCGECHALLRVDI
jgi:hypothetical protein